MVIILLLASLNSCVNPWIYLSFNDHVTASCLCRRRAKTRYRGSCSYNTGGTTAVSRTSRPDVLTDDLPLRRVSRAPARSTTINDRRRCTSVDLWCHFLLIYIPCLCCYFGTETGYPNPYFSWSRSWQCLNERLALWSSLIFLACQYSDSFITWSCYFRFSLFLYSSDWFHWSLPILWTCIIGFVFQFHF